MKCCVCGKAIKEGNEIEFRGDFYGKTCASKKGLFVNADNLMKIAKSVSDIENENNRFYAKHKEKVDHYKEKFGTDWPHNISEEEQKELFKLKEQDLPNLIEGTKESYFDGSLSPVDYDDAHPLVKDFWMDRECLELLPIQPKHSKSEAEVIKENIEEGIIDEDSLEWPVETPFEERKLKAVNAFCSMFHDTYAPDETIDNFLVLTLDLVGVLPDLNGYKTRFVVQAKHPDADQSKYVQISIIKPEERDIRNEGQFVLHFCRDFNDGKGVVRQIDSKPLKLADGIKRRNYRYGEHLSREANKILQRSNSQTGKETPKSNNQTVEDLRLFSMMTEWFFSDGDYGYDTNIGAFSDFRWDILDKEE